MGQLIGKTDLRRSRKPKQRSSDVRKNASKLNKPSMKHNSSNAKTRKPKRARKPVDVSRSRLMLGHGIKTRLTRGFRPCAVPHNKGDYTLSVTERFGWDIRYRYMLVFGLLEFRISLSKATKSNMTR